MPNIDQSIGPIVTPTGLRRATLAMLQTWFESALAAVARNECPDHPAHPDFDPMNPLDPVTGLGPPRTWTRPVDPRAVALDQTPCVVVTSPGIDRANRDGSKGSDPAIGNWSARWMLAVTCIIRGDTYDQVADRIGWYVSAARVAILQHGIGFEGAGKPWWRGETYHELDTDDARSIGGGTGLFSVDVANAVNDYAGPTDPPAAPSYIDGDGVEVTDTLVTVDHG